MGFGEPVGKTNFVLGSKSGNVFVVPGKEGTGMGTGMGMGKERRIEAREGPVCEVPWRKIRVVLWGLEGCCMKGGGCAISWYVIV